MSEIPLKQVLLRILVGALVLSALVGIYAFLFGEFGETEIKILLTTMAISYFSVTSLACAAAFERDGVRLLTIPGLITGVVGFLMFVPGIWAEWFESEPYAKTMIVLGIFSFSFAQACLLSLATLERRFQWVLYAAFGSIFALASLISGMVIFEVGDEWLFRFAGVLGILDGCATVSLPALAKFGKREEAVERARSEVELRCPRCGQPGTYPMGEFECQNCSQRIRIELIPEESPALGEVE